MYFNTGFVGIGKTIPLTSLDINGNVFISGKFGINNTAPGYDLDVTGNIRATSNMLLTSGNLSVTGNGYISGRLGINNLAPAYSLDTTGNFRVTGSSFLTNIQEKITPTTGISTAYIADYLNNSDDDGSVLGHLEGLVIHPVGSAVGTFVVHVVDLGSHHRVEVRRVLSHLLFVLLTCDHIQCPASIKLGHQVETLWMIYTIGFPTLYKFIFKHCCFFGANTTLAFEVTSN
jgi:hypothetical protein